MSLIQETRGLITAVRTFLEDSPWERQYLLRVERLFEQIDRPCVLAVAGMVKAGKSTLVNALLGGEYSLAGATETTATVNYFRFGIADDEKKPVICYWKDGRQTHESIAFVNSLQGTEEETLTRAEQISHLEFILPNPMLRDITLVDTPGTDAMTGEDGLAHEKVTQTVFSATDSPINGDVAIHARTRSEQLAVQSRVVTEQADAVLYLVGQVAKVSNESFLTEFRRAFSGNTRSFNAVGIMSKMDVQDDILEQRDVLAATVSQKLEKELNTVIPVSAALWATCHKLNNNPEQLGRIKHTVDQLPEKRFERMLGSERSYLRDYSDCAVSMEDRERAMQGMPWRIFVLLARALRGQNPSQALNDLRNLSGFEALHSILETHFFRRAKLLRCFRIVAELQQITAHIQRAGLFQYRKEIKQLRKQLEKFVDFIVDHPEGRSTTANELRRFLETHVPEDQSEKLKDDVETLAQQVEAVKDRLDEINLQFAGLELLEKDHDAFSSEEYAELQILFGAQIEKQQAPASKQQLAARQIFWRNESIQSAVVTRKKVAELAVHFYGGQLR